jgi:4-hydroxy 2-oxovalerate aldolase
MDRNAVIQGWVSVYSSFLLHAEHAADRYGGAHAAGGGTRPG